MTSISWLNAQDFGFPDVSRALRQPNGLLALGGDLSPQRLLRAYAQGIFPWYEAGQPILWWSPDPRSVLFPQGFHRSRSLQKRLKHNEFALSFDSCFDAVIQHCAREGSLKGTWITADIKTAYGHLHQMGIAHSVESWSGGELVGGLYGLAMGSVFFGESMFSIKTDASKVAMSALVDKLLADGFTLIDCQVHNAHLASLGAIEIPRRQFIDLLAKAIEHPATSCWR